MAPSLRTNPRKTAKAASSEAMNEAMEEEIRKRTMESPPEEKNAGGTKRHKTARGISGEVVAITPEKEEPKRLKTAEVSVARGAVETELYVKKDSGSIIAELQTALIKERIKNGWDLEEIPGKKDPFALIAELQKTLTEETVQHRMELEEGRNKIKWLEARLEKMDQYKRRAREAEDELKAKVDVKEQDMNLVNKLKVEMEIVLQENSELERRLSGIVAIATGQQPEESPTDMKDAATPSPKREQVFWSSDEMMSLYRHRQAIGRNDWAKIVATGDIPNRSSAQIQSKWDSSTKNKRFNPLEKSFKDGNAKVAKKTTEDVKVVGTVTDYKMDAETREGTWTITYEDGTTEEMKKDGLLAALDLFDDKKQVMEERETGTLDYAA